MDDERIIKSYVWHNEKCFFVSTIERDGSSMLSPHRYNETFVWEYNWDKADRGDMICQEGTFKECLKMHFSICERLYKTGKCVEEKED